MKTPLKIAGIAIGIALFAAFFLGIVSIRNRASQIRIAFLDVGQGDAILITRGSNQALIDTGKNGRLLLSELGEFLSPWDKTIETVLLTHSDQDHVGALPDLLSRYRVEMLLSSDISEETEMDRSIRNAISLRNVRTIVPSAGLSVAFSSRVKLEILFPDALFAPHLKNTNAGSVVSLLRVGEESFLFSGDLPKEELALPATDIHILKVSHHGSKYSTSDTFLDRMKPEEAIISVGKNSYGHPAQEVLDRLERRDIRALRTDTAGTIVYKCSIAPDASCVLVQPKL